MVGRKNTERRCQHQNIRDRCDRAAFDTIDRNQLLNIIATIVNEGELRIIRFLLSNTKINTRINDATKTNTFISNVGTPQGDSLCPVLFIAYIEHALKEVRTTLPRTIVKYEKENKRDCLRRRRGFYRTGLR